MRKWLACLAMAALCLGFRAGIASAADEETEDPLSDAAILRVYESAPAEIENLEKRLAELGTEPAIDRLWNARRAAKAHALPALHASLAVLEAETVEQWMRFTVNADSTARQPGEPEPRALLIPNDAWRDVCPDMDVWTVVLSWRERNPGEWAPLRRVQIVVIQENDTLTVRELSADNNPLMKWLRTLHGGEQRDRILTVEAVLSRGFQGEFGETDRVMSLDMSIVNSGIRTKAESIENSGGIGFAVYLTVNRVDSRGMQARGILLRWDKAGKCDEPELFNSAG